jgi:uncharacterized protein YecT (DUF1311 family)
MPPIVAQALLALMLLSASAFAAGTKYDQSVDCSHRDNLNNYELNQCQGRAIEKADVELGTAYKALMDKTLEAKRPLLVAAERAWIAWRDRECDLTAEVVDGYDKSGTGYGLSWGICRANLTTERTKQLRAYLREVQAR